MDHKKESTDFWSSEIDRRQMLKTLGVVGSVMALSGPQGLAQAMAQRQTGSGVETTELAAGASITTGEIPKRVLGKTGVDVSVLCFGGAHWGA